VHAQLAHQALRHHAQQRRRQQERFDAHVEQAGDGRGGVVGVQGRQHQVAGERSLHRDLRGFQVADLADHDHVRVLAQDRAQGLGEAHVDARVDLGLADADQVVLDRVFHRHDVGGGRVQARQRRVQRGGLARAGRAGDQHDAVRLVDQAVELRQQGGLHAQVRSGRGGRLPCPAGAARRARRGRSAGSTRARRPACRRRAG
jgi:hypothetical protein